MAKKEENPKTITTKKLKIRIKDSVRRSIGHKLSYCEKRNEIGTKGALKEQRVFRRYWIEVSIEWNVDVWLQIVKFKKCNHTWQKNKSLKHVHTRKKLTCYC